MRAFVILILLALPAIAEDSTLRAKLTLPRQSPEAERVVLVANLVKNMDRDLYSWASEPPRPEPEMVWVRYGFGPWYKVKAFLTDEERLEFLKKIGQL